MVEISEIIFNLEVQLKNKQAELDKIIEILRQDSIRTSTAKRFTVDSAAIEAGKLKPALESAVQTLQLQLNNALLKLPIEIEGTDIIQQTSLNIGILALIVVGVIVVLR